MPTFAKSLQKSSNPFKVDNPVRTDFIYLKNMKKSILLPGLLLVTIFSFAQGKSQKKNHKEESISFYQKRLEDPDALYFTHDKYNIKADGSADVSVVLQEAINEVKIKHNFGILFIPEGTYRISHTIYVPQGIRVIGYGSKRPVIVLAKNSPGYQVADSTDKGVAKYMFWFVNGMKTAGKPVYDAGASTFYSALSNVNLKIEDGNPFAVALRTHYAQHSFIAHVDIYAGHGKAGMFDVGNEMEDVKFFGGDYGIYTTKPSPGWQFMTTDTYFEGQRKAAIRTREAGLTIVRMRVKNVPAVIDMMPEFHERLFMEDCHFENVSGAAITIGLEDNAKNQVSLRNIDCKNVPLLVSYLQSGKQTKGAGSIYKVKNYMHGLQMDSLQAEPLIHTIEEIESLPDFPAPVATDIPAFPAIDEWTNLRSLGAVGDGITDDTKVIQDAIDKYPTIYVPQGWYRVSETIRMKPNTVLIGLTPIGTQFILENYTEAFGSFGPPKPLLETSKGGMNIVSGIGLSTGAENSRAVACKWMAGASSYMNDVKFVGGHGGMERIGKPALNEKRQPVPWNAIDPAWDTQYWSLWITAGGGGVFKNIWTASSFATAGTYISHTSTPGRIYAMSIEHHVRNEIRFNHVSNWKVYALQLEEESREGTECLPVELDHCNNMVFANLYLFRVIRLIKPFPFSIRNWSSENIEFLNVHNYSQIKYTTNTPLYDINTNTTVRPWEFNRLWLGKTIHGTESVTTGKYAFEKLASGFELAEGLSKDSKGNIYFCESRLRRIYKWSVDTRSLSLIADYPWEPLSLACDKNDNLLVVFKYVPKPGYLVHGKPETFTNPPDAAGTSFSGWGNSGFATFVYSVNPANPDETLQQLPKAKMGSIPLFKALYPAHRWRDSHDFNTVTVNHPDECFVAPDGVTVIPVVYDLARAATLTEAIPGNPLYVTDEYEKRTVKLNINKEGYVSDLKLFAENGEFSSAVDANGNVYIADGDLYVFDRNGKKLKMIKTPERPSTIVIGGKDNKTLYMTGNTSVFSLSIE
ncbi:MAG: gluconolaconase [Chitinophagaceae bacterium]|nr:gluconolaconase [Chitinophagaceae bacterium]